jgi:hypothetical protein
MRFSPKAMRAVVRMWEEEKKTENVLQGMIRLIAWQYRWYSEVSAEASQLSEQVLTWCLVFTRIVAHHPEVDRRRGRS